MKKPPLCNVIGFFGLGAHDTVILEDIGNHAEHLEIGEDPAAAVRDHGKGACEVFYRDMRRGGKLTEITWGRREES
jgi:hypothetical protein